MVSAYVEWRLIVADVFDEAEADGWVEPRLELLRRQIDTHNGEASNALVGLDEGGNSQNVEGPGLALGQDEDDAQGRKLLV